MVTSAYNMSFPRQFTTNNLEWTVLMHASAVSAFDLVMTKHDGYSCDALSTTSLFKGYDYDILLYQEARVYITIWLG